MVRGFGSFGDDACGQGQFQNPGVPFAPACLDCSWLSTIEGAGIPIPQQVIDECKQVAGAVQTASGGSYPSTPPATPQPSSPPPPSPQPTVRPSFTAYRPSSLARLTTQARASQLAAQLAEKKAREAKVAYDEEIARQKAGVTEGGSSNFSKYGLYAAAALAVGGIIWFASKKRQS